MVASLAWHGSAPRPPRAEFSMDRRQGPARTGKGSTSQMLSANQITATQVTADPVLGASPAVTSTMRSSVATSTVATSTVAVALPAAEVQANLEPPHPSDLAGEVEQLFHQELDRHPHFRGRSEWIQARFRQGTLRLEGTLPTFYLKQVAQTVAHRVPAVSRVVNRIEVRDGVSSNSRLETWKVG